jgi:restriction system protein
MAVSKASRRKQIPSSAGQEVEQGQRPSTARPQVRGSLGAHEQGLIITTGDFSKGAKDEATRPDAVPVALMNGEQLVVLMVQHEVMVARRPHDILDLSLTDVD